MPSALVKLFVNEKGSDIVREYFKKHTIFYTTSLCFAETLGVLKSKSLKKEISQSQYFCACDELISHIAGETIGIDEIKIANSETYSEVEAIASKYNLDVADAF
jgi:predicted nucleic acid-binding protein